MSKQEIDVTVKVLDTSNELKLPGGIGRRTRFKI